MIIDYFYLDGHFTNLVLFPSFFVALFFIIRFIEMVDHGYIPFISNTTCKKCRTRYGLMQVCKHDKYSIMWPLIPSIYGYFVFVFWAYVYWPYHKSLPPYIPYPQIFRADGQQVRFESMIERIQNHISDTPNQIAYFSNGTQAVYIETKLEMAIHYLLDSLLPITMGV